ncbi:MAG: hypothetical protein ACHQ4G_08830, partial [Opitutales bacterium]
SCAARVRTAQEVLLQAGRAEARQIASVWLEPHPGPVPTIVLGGFVPDSTEQVFLLRGHLLKSGPLYYLNYPPDGFSLDLFCAQLDDLVAEITLTSAQPPVVFAVSFGGGLVLVWLRRARARGRELPLSGVVLVSPVACIEDLIAPGETKASTLLGRALLPYVNAREPVGPAVVEKSRAIFSRMFEAGAQNKESTRLLLTAGELEHLRSAVQETIRRVSPVGAWERVQALRAMATPDSGFPPASPLTAAPVLILYAEKESAVLTAKSPTRLALESAHRSWFPESKVWLITNRGGPPVQHASLVFHYGNFLPFITAFYRRLRNCKVRAAA